MDKEITFKHFAIGLLFCLLPTVYAIWSNSKHELRKTVEEHSLNLENHELRINIQEKQNEYQVLLLDQIAKGIVDIQLQLKDKKDRD